MQAYQIEQDLVISRALVEIFSHPVLGKSLAFRGGTALYKLHFRPPQRYSEDIDLVQIRAEPAGPVMTALREVLEPWLGPAQWKQSAGRVTLNFRFDSEDQPPIPLRLKVEINTREHFSVFGYQQERFEMASRWFSGEADICSYSLEELLGTKLRALYQRKKGRDLFDLATALDSGEASAPGIVEAFLEYMTREGHGVRRQQFVQNMSEKMNDRKFTADISPLLASGVKWNMHSAAERVSSALFELLPE
ncbi:MAG: nucleotidyl transferase AbiEii/AbiGii toxin family protein [Rhodothermales bacterium]